MDFNKPVYRIGETNQYVQPGDFVWTDVLEARWPPDGARLGLQPVVTEVPVSGRVQPDGKVLLACGRFVELRNCRLVEKVIRI